MAREDITERIHEMDAAMKRYRDAQPRRGCRLLISAQCQSRAELLMMLDEIAHSLLSIKEPDAKVSCASGAGWWFEYDEAPWKRLEVEGDRYFLTDMTKEIF